MSCWHVNGLIGCMARSAQIASLGFALLVYGVAEAENKMFLVQSASGRVEVRLRLDEPIAGFQFSINPSDGAELREFEFEHEFKGTAWMSGSHAPGDSVLNVLVMSLSLSRSLPQGDWVLGSFAVDIDTEETQSPVTLLLERSLISDHFARSLPLETAHLTIDPSASFTTSAQGAAFDTHPPFPNPFNPTTRLRYTLHRPSRVRVTVYDILGRVVAPLLNDHMPEGTFALEWNGRDRYGNTISSGTYFFAVVVGEQVRVERVSLKK